MIECPFGNLTESLDRRRRRSYDPPMPVWRCPHCATPQAESSRCWVCRRSTTSCATCRHFRRGVAGGLGICGLAPRRSALDGTEMRACWTGMPRGAGASAGRWAAVSEAQQEPVAVGAIALGKEPRPPRTFVPVEALETSGPHVAEMARDPVPAMPSPVTRVPGTWWLWGDPEPWPET